MIGIWKTRFTADPNVDVDESDGKYYGWSTTHGRTTVGDSGSRRGLNYGKRRCRAGDVITMTVDFNQKSIRYTVNDKDFGVAFDGILMSKWSIV